MRLQASHQSPNSIVGGLCTAVEHHYSYTCTPGCGWWGLHISDTPRPEHCFIISHVHSVIRPCSGPGLVDFEPPSVHWSPLPAETPSTFPTRSHLASYSCGRSVITAVWILSAGGGGGGRGGGKLQQHSCLVLKWEKASDLLFTLLLTYISLLTL